MKVIQTPTGWQEVTTKIFTVEQLSTNPLAENAGEFWESCQQLKLYKRRTCCQRCRKRWGANPDESVWLAFTDKGNRLVCSSCKDELAEVVS